MASKNLVGSFRKGRIFAERKLAVKEASVERIADDIRAAIRSVKLKNAKLTARAAGWSNGVILE
ncbi:MAG: hypothetical protein NUV67_06090, partial [archaeon]|nr:hypothetical protein [archaeon]